jgi:DtxR family Mn-dependent transcriptional regulator
MSESPEPASSATESEYLVQLYLLVREGRRVVGARIAERLGVSPPAVSQALRRLEQHELVVLDPEDGVGLTASGKGQAERTIRRHYLLERLLVDELGFDWVDVDEEADRLEHSLSTRLEEHLFDRLGQPTTCPHGNPFPGSPDEQRLLDAPRLSDALVGAHLVMVRITADAEENHSLMRRLDTLQLKPGSNLTVTRRSAEEIELLITGADAGNNAFLPMNFARHLRVEGAVEGD